MLTFKQNTTLFLLGPSSHPEKGCCKFMSLTFPLVFTPRAIHVKGKNPILAPFSVSKLFGGGGLELRVICVLGCKRRKYQKKLKIDKEMFQSIDYYM